MVAALLDDTTNDRIIVLEGDLFAHAIRSDCRALSERTTQVTTQARARSFPAHSGENWLNWPLAWPSPPSPGPSGPRCVAPAAFRRQPGAMRHDPGAPAPSQRLKTRFQGAV